MLRILFVCLGNICRSPAAEIIFNAYLKSTGASDFAEADSAGTINYHEGSQPDIRMLRALEQRGYTYGGHRSRQVTQSDFFNFDLLVPMDEKNQHDLLALATKYNGKATIIPMCHFARQSTNTHVPDPYYGTQDDFNEVITLLEDCCEGLLLSLRKGAL